MPRSHLSIPPNSAWIQAADPPRTHDRPRLRLGRLAIVGKRGTPYYLAYSASKFALDGMADSLRAELVGSGVSLGVIYPSSTTTEFDERRLSEGPLLGKTHLIMDLDGKFCSGFRSLLQDIGIEAVRLPPRSPNLNAYCERFVLSIKAECLNQMIFFSAPLLLPPGSLTSSVICAVSGSPFLSSQQRL